jgi:hypothetical protein
MDAPTTIEKFTEMRQLYALIIGIEYDQTHDAQQENIESAHANVHLLETYLRGTLTSATSSLHIHLNFICRSVSC